MSKIEQLRGVLARRLVLTVKEAEELINLVEMQHTALKEVAPLLSLAFDYEGNVFGVNHNNAVDAEDLIRQVCIAFDDWNKTC